jgi:hypothetical protein
MKIAIASLLAWLFAFPAANAEQEAKIQISVFCPIYVDGLKTIFIKGGTDSFQSLDLSSANIVEAKGAMVEEGKISIHGPAAADGVRRLVASVEVAGLERPLVILVPSDEGAELPFKSKSVESKLEKFPFGSFKMVNMAPYPVRINVGDKMIEIAVGAESSYSPTVAAGDSVAVTIDYNPGNGWQLMSSARWASRKDRRSLLCFEFDKVSKRMAIKSVPLRNNPKK